MTTNHDLAFIIMDRARLVPKEFGGDMDRLNAMYNDAVRTIEQILDENDAARKIKPRPMSEFRVGGNCEQPALVFWLDRIGNVHADDVSSNYEAEDDDVGWLPLSAFEISSKDGE